MSNRAPDDVLQLVPDADSARIIRELHSGLTNRSYLVDIDGRLNVLRIDTEAVTALGLDRSTEAAIQRQAAEAGFAPAVRHADPAAGILISEYLPGRALHTGDLADIGTLERIACLLRAVHALPRCGRALDTAHAARRYARIVAGDAEFEAFASHCVGIVSTTPTAGRTRCCHNDVVAGNFIDDGELSLIDWEYACDNDPMFDLASLIAYHDLDKAHAAAFVAAYTGGPRAEDRERLALQHRLFDALQWLWLAARQALMQRPCRTDRLVQLAERIG